MTQSTDHGPLLPRPGRPAARRVPAAGGGVLAGAVAAALGLGSITVVVLLLWVASPYPDAGGPSGALRVAADLWLLAHGAMLVREETRSGAPAPMGVTPLLLCALPVWLLHRAARHALEQATPDEPDRPQPAQDPDGPDVLDGPDWYLREAAAPRPPVPDAIARTPRSPVGARHRALLDPAAAWRARRTIGWLCAGYLAVGAVAVVHASAGPLRVDPLSALLHLPPVAALAASLGVWTAYGRPLLPVPAALRRSARRLPLAARTRLRRPRLVAAARAGAAGTAALVGGGALLVAASLAWHGATATSTFPVPAPWPAQAALLLTSVVLVPNAAIWAASYGLGPGFALGADCTAAPFAAAGCRVPADFPLLAAVPAGHGAWAWAAGVVPLAAGVTIGWFTARAAVDSPDVAAGRRGTALTALLAAVGCGAAVAVLARWAGGPLGTGALARFGPHAPVVGAAAVAATAPVGVASALLLRAWWLRRRRSYRDGPRTMRLAAAPGGGSFADRPGAPVAEPEDGAETWSVWQVGTDHRPGEPGEPAGRPWWRVRRRAARPALAGDRLPVRWGRAAWWGRGPRSTQESASLPVVVMPPPRACADVPLDAPPAVPARGRWSRIAARRSAGAGGVAARCSAGPGRVAGWLGAVRTAVGGWLRRPWRRRR